MAMNEWQSMAMETLPEMESDIMEAETPMALWVQIVYAFDEAYEQPQNDDFIKRVYQYADWCLQDVGETAEEHLLTCVAICFWEHIPTNEAARRDLPRWYSWEHVMANEHFFTHQLADDELADLKQVYAAANSSGATAA
jgi:hypothetical protein